MVRFRRGKMALIFLNLLCCGGIFFTDIHIPLGVAAGMPYVGVILISRWLRDFRFVVLMAVLTTALTVAGYYLSPPEGEPWMIVTNRALSVGVIWLTASLVVLAERSREERLSSEARMEAVLDTAPEGIFTIDSQGTVAFLNQAAVRMFGYALEEVVGKNVNLLMPHPYHGEHDGYLKSYLTTGGKKVIGIDREVEGLRKDGSVFPLGLLVGEFEQSGKKMFTGILRDISDRKKSEQNLLESATTLRLAQEISGVGVWDWDMELDQLECSGETLSIFGYPVEKTDCTHQQLIAATHPEEMDSVVETLRLAMEGKGEFHVQHRIVLSDLSTKFVRQSAMVFHDKQGRAVRMLGVIQDITEQMSALQNARELSEKLARSNLELEGFASVASHDLQEPLRKIEAFGHRLKTRIEGKDADNDDYLERIFSASHRMRALIEDLLSYSRVTWEDKPFAPVNLEEITREVMGDLEIQIKGLQAHVEFAPLPSIQGNPSQIRQLIQNLIGNALKYHRPNVPPYIKIFRTEVGPGMNGDFNLGSGSFCQINFQDNGLGFDQKYSDQVFSPFKRLHGRGTYEGTGLGLALCRKIVGLHRGSITVSSQEGAGSTFQVVLPLRPGS